MRPNFTLAWEAVYTRNCVPLGATLAQLVERLIRNQKVASSILAGGSRLLVTLDPYQCITWPPSTLIVCPVTAEARDDDKKATMSAISAGSCHRANGATALIFSAAHSS